MLSSKALNMWHFTRLILPKKEAWYFLKIMFF